MLKVNLMILLRRLPLRFGTLRIALMTAFLFGSVASNPQSPPASPGSVSIRSRARAGRTNSRFDVVQPPFGFVVDGSSIEEMNGIYGPRLPRRDMDRDYVSPPPQFSRMVHVGAYKHDSSGWWLVNLKRTVSRSSQRGEHAMSGTDVLDEAPTPEGEVLTEVEWLFVDSKGHERFRLPGEGLVPGYGSAWSHVTGSGIGSDSGDNEFTHVHHNNTETTDESFDEFAAEEEALEEVAPQGIDEAELPLLIAPIPADHNGGITSHYFEQMLPQLIRYRQAKAFAASLRRYGSSPWNETAASDEDKFDHSFHHVPAEDLCPKWLFPEDSIISYKEMGHKLYKKEDFELAAGCFAAAVNKALSLKTASEDLLFDVAELQLLQASSIRRSGNFTSALSLIRSTISALQSHCMPDEKHWQRRKIFSVRSYLAIGETLLDAGRPDDALSGLRQAYALLLRPREYDEETCMEVEVDGALDDSLPPEDEEYDDDDEEDSDEELDKDPEDSLEGKRLHRLLVLATAASRRENPPPHFVAPPASERDECTLVQVGPHLAIWPMSIKDIEVEALEGKVCPEEVNRTNWAGDEGYSYNAMRMRFRVLQSGKHLKISRLPEEGVVITHGWGSPLQFFCCAVKGNEQKILPESHMPAAAGEDAEALVASAQTTIGREIENMKDHYAVLGLNRDFSDEELKKSFRKLSRVFHPDRPGGSAEKFARISVAHDCLSNSNCRESFDTGKDLGRAGCDSAEFSLEEDVDYIYWPERRPFQPFGDPANFCRGPDCPRH